MSSADQEKDVQAIALDLDSKEDGKPIEQQQQNTGNETEKQQLKVEDKQENSSQVPMKQGMSKKKKICIGCSIFGVILLGLCIYFGYNLYKYGALLPSTYTDDDPVMKGYDVVEYFNIGASAKGVKGKSEHEFKYDGANFWFKNAANKALFVANPEQYAPQIGGFCTWGLWDDFKNGKKWRRDHLGPPCDPDYGWTVYKNKLYCNFSDKLRKEFFGSNVEENMAIVEALWIGWMGNLGSKAGYFNNRCFSNNPRYCESTQFDFGQGAY